MDDEIQETVESLLGKGVKIVDCEKKSSIKEEEVLMINGCPIELEGEDGAAIREALLRGNIPDCDILNQILVRAGILKVPVRLETSLSVKSTVSTREEVTVAKGGHVIDERCRETKENSFYSSASNEVWEPVAMVHQEVGSNRLPRTGTPCPRQLFPLGPSASSSKLPPFPGKNDGFYDDSFLRNSESGSNVMEENSKSESSAKVSSRFGVGAAGVGVGVDQTDSASKLVNGLHTITLNHKSAKLPAAAAAPAPASTVPPAGPANQPRMKSSSSTSVPVYSVSYQ